VTDPRWTLLHESRDALVDAFSGEGVGRVEYVAAFPEQASFSVWLGTTTDAEAILVRGPLDLHERVHRTLREEGFDERDLDHLRVLVQSQETVDRDHDGSWSHALR